MDIQFIIDTLRAVKLELYRHRLAAVIIFMVVTAGVLTLGYITPKSYTAQAVLYADQSNILQPLLQGKAELTQLDRINEARELMQSRSFLEQVALDNGLIRGGETDAVQNGKISDLRKQVGIRVSNRNFLELSYTSGSPNESFQVLSTVLNRFIERTLRKKRSESQGAFEFIDSQVKTYQRQLEEAEQRLKEFKSGIRMVLRAVCSAELKTSSWRSSKPNPKCSLPVGSLTMSSQCVASLSTPASLPQSAG